jgi:methionine-gamma-lyase
LLPQRKPFTVSPGGEGYVYSRYGNPTVHSVEERLASLEGAEEAILCASGMAAITVALLSQLRSGDHCISEESIYGGTLGLFGLFPNLGIEVTLVDTLDRARLESSLRPNTRVLYLETPANPLLKVLPLGELAAWAHSQGLLSVVDSTFATPYLQRPLEMGIDLVVHSATKFLGGHGDLTAGLVAGRRELLGPMRTSWHRLFGPVLSPFEAFLLGRGLETLPLRLERSSQSALGIAHFLQQSSQVARVFYPGLPSHPQYAIACRQMDHGFGGMVAFEMKNGYPAAVSLQDGLCLIQRVASLGDARTLIMHPASSSHRLLSSQERAARGIGEGLLRLSVGLEDPQDLIEDLSQAMPR